MQLEELKTENRLTKSIDNIIQSYKKANKLRKTQILKKYGVSSIDKLTSLLDTSKKDKKVTMTELASLLLNSQNTSIQLSFQKQIKEKDVYNELMKLYFDTHLVATFENKLKESLHKLINGVERIATISHNSKKDKFGRLYATETTVERDEEANSDNRMILISLNHLNWALINGIKYTVK